MLSKLLTGFSLAGKTLLGAGVAVAATGSAGFAGVLPAPVQHAFAVSVDHATPFRVPDAESTGHDEHSADRAGPHGPHGPDGSSAAGSSLLGVLGDDSTTTAAPTPTGGDTTTTSTTESPTTEPTTEPTTTPPAHRHPGRVHPHQDHPSSEPPGDGPDEHHGPGDGPGEHHGPGDGPGERHGPASITLQCALTGATGAHCSWSGDPLADGDSYLLLRVDHGRGRALHPDAGATSYDDTTLEPDTHYSFMVIVVHGATPGTVAHSNRAFVKTLSSTSPARAARRSRRDPSR